MCPLRKPRYSRLCPVARASLTPSCRFIMERAEDAQELDL